MVIGLQELERGRVNRWRIEVFQSPETAFSGTIMVDSCHYTIV